MLSCVQMSVWFRSSERPGDLAEVISGPSGPWVFSPRKLISDWMFATHRVNNPSDWGDVLVPATEWRRADWMITDGRNKGQSYSDWIKLILKEKNALLCLSLWLFFFYRKDISSGTCHRGRDQSTGSAPYSIVNPVEQWIGIDTRQKGLGVLYCFIDFTKDDRVKLSPLPPIPMPLLGWLLRVGHGDGRQGGQFQVGYGGRGGRHELINDIWHDI